MLGVLAVLDLLVLVFGVSLLLLFKMLLVFINTFEGFQSEPPKIGSPLIERGGKTPTPKISALLR